MSLTKVLEPAREVPVASQVDVAVVGGGCAGIGAAIAAARTGARVAFIERLGFYGGCVTATMMDVFWMLRAGKEKAVEGIAMELLRRLKAEMDGVQGEPGQRCFVDAEKFKLMVDVMVNEAEVEPWLHCLGVSPYMQGSTVDGVITESKSGRQAILAKVVVDASGDGDIAARSGAPFEYGRPEDGLVQPASISFLLTGIDVGTLKQWQAEHPEDASFARLVAEAKAKGDWTINRRRFGFHGMYEETGELTGVNATRIQAIDPTNTRDLTRAEMELRRQVFQVRDFVRKYVPGGGKAKVGAIGAQLAPRESRRILGEYVLTADDIIASKIFPDTVAISPCFWDQHNALEDGSRHIYPANVKEAYAASHSGVEKVEFARGNVYGVPYRCLVPREVDNLLVAGRCMSADRLAEASLRYLGASFATGQAAGTAAALAALGNTTPRRLDVELLRRTLAEQGAYLAEDVA